VLVAVTADVVVLTVFGDRLRVLLVRRGRPPFEGRWALPGGFVEEGEALEAAARRELAEETGLDDPSIQFEQLATYGDPGRDPRGQVVTIAHLVLAAELLEPTAGSDAAEVHWRPVDEALAEPQTLAFDHARILGDSLERIRARLEYSPSATALCAAEFTVAELRHVYEVVWGARLDPRNFHRKVTGTPGFLVSTGRTKVGPGGRPAQLYRPGEATLLNPPIARPDTRG
jgi:8-oxo-dGTP diphosphatase